MSKTCNQCNEQFEWAMPYTGKKNNLDGSPHVCQTKIPQDTPPPGTVSVNAPPIDRTAVITEIKEFIAAFNGVSDIAFDAASRIYISRTMRR